MLSASFQYPLNPYVSFFNLQDRFLQWATLHAPLWKWMSYQALHTPGKMKPIPDQFVDMIVEPNWDQGDLVRRSFRVRVLVVRSIERELPSMIGARFAQGIMENFRSREEEDGIRVVYVIRCLSLLPHYEGEIIPLQYAKKAKQRRDWTELTAKDIEEGSLFSTATDIEGWSLLDT